MDKVLLVKLVSTFIIILLSPVVNQAQNFITTWKTDNPGTSSSVQITIPTTGGGYLYNVAWVEVGVPANNGSLAGITGSTTVTFPTAGIYRVEISGSFPRIFFSGGGDRNKILSVEQWGNIAWTSMNSAFRGCQNLVINATDVPNLSGVTDLTSMFRGATSLNQNIDNWNVGSITNMSNMFNGAASFNQPLNNWNVSNVTNMNSMFFGADVFNQDLSGWDVSEVTNMASMFRNAFAFNGDVTTWDVSNVTTMSEMFVFCTVFNQDIGAWNTGSVTDMSSMFNVADIFNQNINGWNVSNVVTMFGMFNSARDFNQPINSWNVSSVTTMQRMFNNASSFNQNLNSWNVSSVTNMASMFEGASVFNGAIDNWNVSNLTNMSSMFRNASAFNQDIGGWDVSSVTTMNATFSFSIFNQDISSWNLASLLDMSNMFTFSAFNLDISTWDVSTVTSMRSTFSGSIFNQPIGNWNVGNVTDMTSMFASAQVFNQDIGSWDVSNALFMGNMFNNANAFNQDLSSWNVSSVTNMSGMFNLTLAFDQNLGSWDVSNVINMAGMFNSSGISLCSYDQTLIGWASLSSLQNGITLGASGVFYCNGETARNNIISSYGWTIIDAGLNCSGNEISVFAGASVAGAPITSGQVIGLDFGSELQGADVIRQFTIRNQGTSPLTITNISITGTAFSLLSIPPVSIASCATETISIILNGANAGTFIETITIINSDADEGTFVFGISGIVTPSTCTVLPTVNAGLDQVACPGTGILLTGTLGGSAIVAEWSTTGTGFFDDATLLNATYTPSIADELIGSIILTLTVAANAPCPQVEDEVLITVNQPISAGSPTIQSNIGEPVTINTISLATLNPGDVVTATLLLSPAKGDVIINANNTIDYTSLAGNVGPDSFTYRICNQCSLCSDGVVSVSILNEAPVLTAPANPITAAVGQTVFIPFSNFIDDVNDNIDFSSIQILSGPTSNASVLFDSNFNLIIDYSNVSFVGTDQITIEVCDLEGACSQLVLQIDVEGDIVVYNGISPNEDGRNDFFKIENIQFIEPKNKVLIFNRWGDKVFEIEDYDNDSQRFEGKQTNGKELPSGVYFYKVIYLRSNPPDELTGYITIKR